MKRALTGVSGIVLALTTATVAWASPTKSAAQAAPGASGSGVVLDWNRALLKIVRTPGAQPATIHPTRSFAIMHAAIYDAVVSTTRGGSPYRFSVHAGPAARPDAAAAEAGHDTLVALYPAQQEALDQQLSDELGTIPDGPGKTEGVQVGGAIARLELAARADDGSAATPPALAPGTKPGEYRPAPPAFAAAVFTHWPAVTPFVLPDADRFRPAPPPALTSPVYAAAINEVKSLGQDSSTTRTPDQTTAATFWAQPIWNYWNEIAQQAALDHHTDLLGTARLFAALNLTFADSVIAFYDAKYTYRLWRPVTAIREAGDDGNPATVGDPTWSPLAATPADPSYPGAHSVISTAGATVLSAYFGRYAKVTVTSPALPGVTRSFGSYFDAAQEAGLSRIYAGLHTRIDHVAGTLLGRDVALYDLAHAFAPRHAGIPVSR
ncbi:MAG: vanadium-dependent haloperoxidase [Frankia sp.]